MDTAPTAIASDLAKTPGWVHDAVFYQIFPDRFARSDRVPKPSNIESWDSPPTVHGYKGGDLIGIVEHLDYLQDLGVTALYLCPVFKSTANHRYHTSDYYEIDPILGGNDGLGRLIDAIHQRGMRLVLDGVFNHTGRGFFQFTEILENGGASPYIDWYTVRSWPLHPYGPADEPSGYDAWWGDRALPKLNLQNPVVREYLWNVGTYWIGKGIDGWRLDVPEEIDDDFWREFRRRVRGVNPEAYIVGEIWHEAAHWLSGDEFDGVMNYLLAKACIPFFSRGSGVDDAMVHETLQPLEAFDGNRFRQDIDQLLSFYRWDAALAQLNLLDSHDTPRILSIARGDDSAFRLALLFLMCFPGAPCIYYGDEVGMQGGPEDAQARGAFPWHPDGWNDALREHVKAAIRLRHAHQELRTGDYTSLWSDENTYVFARRWDTSASICAFNAGNDPVEVEVSLLDNLRGASYEPIWGSARPPVQDGVVQSWHLEPRSASILHTDSL